MNLLYLSVQTRGSLHHQIIFFIVYISRWWKSTVGVFIATANTRVQREVKSEGKNSNVMNTNRIRHFMGMNVQYNTKFNRVADRTVICICDRYIWRRTEQIYQLLKCVYGNNRNVRHGQTRERVMRGVHLHFWNLQYQKSY